MIAFMKYVYVCMYVLLLKGGVELDALRDGIAGGLGLYREAA